MSEQQTIVELERGLAHQPLETPSQDLAHRRELPRLAAAMRERRARKAEAAS